jgi:pimeloyl-ACP methyl ester carboxylesterase
MEVAIIGPDDGEAIQLGPVRMRILEDGSTTDHRLGMGEITLPPRTDGPPQHRHARHDEGFYVVAGTVRFTVGTSTHDAAAGTLVMVPPGAPHTFANPGDETAVLLNTFTPDLYVHYFRDLRDMIASGRPLTPEATVEVMSRYATVPAGGGRPALVLHGGGGPATVAGIAAHLAGVYQVFTPTHPGWDGTERPEQIGTVADLAAAYLRFLADENLRDVLVVGSSMGGWLAAEMALGDADGRIAGLALLDAVGVEVEGEPIRDFFALDARGVAEYSYHDPDRFFVDPATVPPELAARRRANLAALRTLAGPSMNDPGLLGRLPGIRVPAHVIWGDSDRIVTPAYGRAMANALGNARFTVIADAGHLPHLEQPAATFDALDSFLAASPSRPA